MSRYASWGIILDDIIYPDGRTAMGTLGGGGLYAASGMRLWHEEAAVGGAVGEDFAVDSLQPHGFDGRDLVVTGLPTPRAWQVLEEDGRRTQVPRVSPEAWYAQLVESPFLQPMPDTLYALHFLTRGYPPEGDYLRTVASAGVILSGEPIIPPETTPEELDNIRRCLPYYELFSPDEEGAAALVGERPVREQLRSLAQLGPRIVALRQGKAGAIIYDRESDQFWNVPAAEARVVDVTGAGNAFCGGLLVGWCETGNIRRAAAQASVSAAFALEQTGPPPIKPEIMAAAKERAEKIMAQISAWTFGK